MASDLRLRIGGASATITFGGTDAQVANAIRRYMRRLGIPIVDVPQTDMESFLNHLKDDVKRIAREEQIRESDAAAHATHIAQAELDNPL